MGHFWDTSRLLPNLGSRGLSCSFGPKYEPCGPPQIDGLRAIAVLAVVGYHAESAPPARLLGVDVFFVISGYLITSLLHREWAIQGRIDLIAVYARRVRRLLPARLVALAAARHRSIHAHRRGAAGGSSRVRRHRVRGMEY